MVLVMGNLGCHGHNPTGQIVEIVEQMTALSCQVVMLKISFRMLFWLDNPIAGDDWIEACLLHRGPKDGVAINLR